MPKESMGQISGANGLAYMWRGYLDCRPACARCSVRANRNEPVHGCSMSQCGTSNFWCKQWEMCFRFMCFTAHVKHNVKHWVQQPEHSEPLCACAIPSSGPTSKKYNHLIIFLPPKIYCHGVAFPLHVLEQDVIAVGCSAHQVPH